MFSSGGLYILIAATFLILAGLLVFSRKLKWFGHLPGDMRYEGRRTRFYAPLTSMLLLSVLFSLVMFLLSMIF